MWDLLPIAVWLAIWALSLGAAGHVLLNKRHPRGAALWLAIIIFLPLLGAYLYWLLGINRVRRRSLSRRKRSAGDPEDRLVEHACDPPDDLPVDPGLNLLACRVTGHPLLTGNRIRPLYEGNQAFPAMLEAIGGARERVFLSTYILDRDAVGIRTIDSLCAAAGRGVDVRVLVDGIGTSRRALKLASRLRHAGARLAVFHPMAGLPFRYPSLNLRNHRKILVIDGAVGFTGGINITGTHFLSHRKDKDQARDIHFRVLGPVVARMEETFADDWTVATGESASLTAGPVPPPAGDDLVRALTSGPDENFERIYEVVLGALRAARHNVVIMTPYFIPDRAIIQALRSAVLSGVRIRIILPSLSDHPFVQMASMAYLPELLQAGVEVFLAPPPFLHSKLMVVDRVWSLIGSANLDPRSFRLNFEFDLEVYSHNLAGELMAYAKTFITGSHSLTLRELRAKSPGRRLMEGAAKVFSPYL